MWAICKKEWTQYFSGLTGYLIIGFYLLINGLFLFVLPNYNVFDFGYASLQAYFDFAPWFLLLLVPAITMRSFSEEFKQGTFELLSTLPVKSFQLVGAKFLGTYLIVLFSILPTLIYAIALQSLSAVGGLDIGATIGSYFGLLCLAAAYNAIGIFTSSTSKNPLVSLLLSIAISVAMFKGFDWLSAMPVFKNGFDFYIQQLGFAYHYQNISKGVIALNDIIYFITLIMLFAIGTMEQIKGKVNYVILFIVVIVLNYSASLTTAQLDLTKDSRYTLSDNTKQIIKEVGQPIKIHVYLGGDIPTYYKKIAQSTGILLNQLQKINPSQIQWELEVPNKLYKDSALYLFYDSLTKLGVPIERVQDQNATSDKIVDQLVVPAAIVEVTGQKPYAIDLRSGKKYFKP
jgi:ABC-2 type transport system permease protein